MSPFTVEWETDAEDELARIWLRVSDPHSITSAQAKSDQLLSRNPLQCGQHLSEGLFCLSLPPIDFFYSVDTDLKLIIVSWVRLTPA